MFLFAFFLILNEVPASFDHWFSVCFFSSLLQWILFCWTATAYWINNREVIDEHKKISTEKTLNESCIVGLWFYGRIYVCVNIVFVLFLCLQIQIQLQNIFSPVDLLFYSWNGHGNDVQIQLRTAPTAN